MRTEITAADVMPMAEYAKIRGERRRQIIEQKKRRRLAVGPLATFYFENYDTMWQQVHEMLWIEKGGDEQIGDELSAYNPLVPKGDELVATLMFEIEDPVRREQALSGLGGVEQAIAIRIGADRIHAEAELQDGVERTKASGKTSSIHFLHFHFTPAQIAQFSDPAAEVIVAMNHRNYGHMAVMPDEMRTELAADFA